MTQNVQAFVEAAVRTPSLAVERLPILDSSAQTTILEAFNDVHFDYPNELCTSTLFGDRVMQYPEAPCIRYGFVVHR